MPCNAPNNSCSNGVCCAPGQFACGGNCGNRDFDNLACGPNCARCVGGTVCSNGMCLMPPPNDRCDMATPINDTLEILTTLANVSNIGATPHAMGLLCLAIAPPAKTDVFFSFVVPANERHLVYADTFGSLFDTVLAFADSCLATGSATVLDRAPTSGELLCNDDQNINTGCAIASNSSAIVAALDGGLNGTTYYVVMTGYNNQSGRTPLHFVRYRVNPMTTTTFVPGGAPQSYSAFTSGPPIRSPICAGGMPALAPEQTFWWRTCADFPGAVGVQATTCLLGQSYDTHLTYWSSNGGASCNDNDNGCAFGANRSTLPAGALQPAGAGLHVISLDGMNVPGPGFGMTPLSIQH